MFLDIEKAFDSVPRTAIWECLMKKNVPMELIQSVKMLYDDCYSCVQVGNGYSDWFQTCRGVQQGSALSPLLFITIMDEIIKEVKQTTNMDLKAFAFADDIVIWGNSEMEVQERLNVWNDHLKKYGLKVSATKTAAMSVNRQVSKDNIMLEGVQLETVKQYQYLGSIISRDNRIQLELNNRIQKSSQFYQQVRYLLWNKQVPLRSKQTLFQTYFVPILTYGLETCTTTKKR